MHYAPEVVTIEGLMEENTGFGTSKEGDPKSDSKETYYVIWPSQPLDVIANDKETSSGTITETGIDRVQLSGDAKTITSHLNKKVRITGTLIHANTAHHFTKVVLEVKTLEAIK